MRVGTEMAPFREEGTLVADDLPSFIAWTAILLLPSTCGRKRNDGFRAAVELF